MTKRKQEKTLSHVINLFESIKHYRYRLAIVCGDISAGKSSLAQMTCKTLKARYIDLATELLPITTRTEFSPTLGAYGPENLIQYIMYESGKTNLSLLVIDQIEPLVSTFSRSRSVQFFQMVEQAEPLKSVMLFTYLKKQLEDANFPPERLLDLSGREL